MYAHTCGYTWVYVDVHEGVHRYGGQRTTSGVILRYHLPPFRHSLSLACNAPMKLDLLASKPQGLTASVSPVLRLEARAIIPNFLQFNLEVRLRSLCLEDEIIN